MATLKEIAERANVSRTTVSRILNNDSTLSVPIETREKVVQVANHLNYKPARLRRREKAVSINEVGVVSLMSEQDESNDPYFQMIRKGIEMRCAELGINLTNIIRLFNDKNFDTKLKELDGIIVVGDYNYHTSVNIAEQCQQVVFVDYSPDPERYDSVLIDLREATRKVLEYLIDLGHEKIGYIGGSRSTGKDERHKAFEEFLLERNRYNPKHVYIEGWATSAGNRMMEKAIQDGDLPTAFFAANDHLAIGALHRLREAGLNVPDDVSIVGFNDVEMAAFMQPPLTTVKVYPELMGKAAVNLLCDRVEGRELPYKLFLPTKLIVRDSCAHNIVNKSLK